MAKTKRTKKEEDVFKAHLPIYNSEGKEVETLELDKGIFTGQVHKAALYQMVVAYNANQRQGTSSTKTISEVSGGGKKPWMQKGTGRARHGTIRSPLWRHGGIIFGPHPRDYHYQVPKKIRRLALISALNSKLREKNLVGIDALRMEEPKTKHFRALLGALKLTGKTLFIVGSIEEKVALASRNMREVALRDYKNFNVMDLLLSEKVVIAKEAVNKLQERLRE
jgi:large subunit ribosomal protein L4